MTMAEENITIASYKERCVRQRIVTLYFFNTRLKENNVEKKKFINVNIVELLMSINYQ